MKILGIIPARYGSTRLPGKPILEIKGKPMIQWVYENASKSKSLDDLVIATDDQRIATLVESFDGKVEITTEDHLNGTSRCAELAAKRDCDYVINIQGDEPFVDPNQIDELASILDGDQEIGTLVNAIDSLNVLQSPSTAKVILDKDSNAMYFSRQPIPFLRDLSIDQWLENHTYWQHVGMYAYRKDILLDLATLPSSSLEIAESLEQLRWLENGYKITCKETHHKPFGIDTQEDLDKARKP